MCREFEGSLRCALIRITTSRVFTYTHKQGGTKQFKYPVYVWSPAGGWWCNPRYWRRNTAIAFGAVGVLSGCVWYISAQLEVCSLPLYCATLLYQIIRV